MERKDRYHWLPLEKQKDQAKEMEEMTKDKENKN